MLEGEQGVQHSDAHPPVLVHAGEVDTGDVAMGQPAVVVDLDLSVDERTDLGLAFLVAAVELRRIPPMGFGFRNTGAGQPSLISPCSGIVSRIRIRVLRELVTGTKRNVDRLLRDTVAVEEPVVVLELNPGGGDGAQNPRGFEGVAPSAAD